MKRRRERTGTQRVFTRLYQSLGQKMGAQLFEEVRDATSLRPRITVAKIAAAGVATVVHGLTLAFIAAGAFLILRGSSLGYVIGGIFCLLVAATLRPRLGRRPKAVVPTAKIPELSAFVDEVGAALGARRVDGILISSQFNASTWKAGWRRRTYVSIGLPLLAPLSPQDRVALIGHELGHQVNGDPRRGSFVGTALASLQTWYELLRPLGARDLPEILASAVLVIPATLARWTAFGLIHLIWREGQRAKYLADELAAAVAGTDAAVAALEKVSRVSVWEQALHTLRHNRQAGVRFFDQYRNLFLERPASEADRVHGREMQQGFRLDVTHPPNVFRIEFLRAHPHAARVSLSAERSAKIDRELEPFEDRIEQQLLHSFGHRAGLARHSHSLT